jgi:hypothetical protein
MVLNSRQKQPELHPTHKHCVATTLSASAQG